MVCRRRKKRFCLAAEKISENGNGKKVVRKRFEKKKKKRSKPELMLLLLYIYIYR